MPSQWWTTTDVANYLGLKVGTVSSYRARGQMPQPDQTVGRTHMWDPERIKEWRPPGDSRESPGRVTARRVMPRTGR